MEIQKDKNYKPLKLSWKTRLLSSIILDGALILNMVEGAIEGWNYESMQKQHNLTTKFKRKYEEAVAKSEKLRYSINGKSVDDYLNESN